jgi:hypothetical protein
MALRVTHSPTGAINRSGHIMCYENRTSLSASDNADPFSLRRQSVWYRILPNLMGETALRAGQIPREQVVWLPLARVQARSVTGD